MFKYAVERIFQMYKRIVVLVSVIMLLIVSCVACSKPAATPETAPPSDGSIRGIVADATSSTVTIQVPNGSEFTFGIEGVEISSSKGLLIGDDITIHYMGEFDDSTQVQAVKVSGIFVEAEAAGTAAPATPSKPAPSKPAPTAPLTGPDSGLPADADKEMVATVDQINGDNTFFASDTTGVDYRFSLAGVVVESSDGTVHEGDTISIYYTGPIEATDKVQSKITISKIVVK